MQEKLRKLSNQELLIELKSLDRDETSTLIKVLGYLQEVDSRKLYREQGFSSLFAFYVNGFLKYSESDAYRRIAVARLAVNYPRALELLLEKQVSLSTLALISGIITEENHSEVLDSICGKSKREVEALVAAKRPKKALRESVRPVTVQEGVSKNDREGSMEMGMPLFSGSDSNIDSSQSTDNPTLPGESPATEPETEDRVELRFSLSTEEYAQFREFQALLTGKHPKGAAISAVVMEGVEFGLEKLSPKRRAERRSKRQVKKQRTEVASQDTEEVKNQSRVVTYITVKEEKRSRHIPSELRDEVWVRDGDCCTFVGEGGKRCGSRHDVELHHVEPFGKGGKHSVSNLTLHCRVHNAYAAELDYGEVPYKSA